MPLSMSGEKSRKTAFSKMVEQKFFICGAILTNKRSILTNSAMGILFLLIILTLNIFLSMN